MGDTGFIHSFQQHWWKNGIIPGHMEMCGSRPATDFLEGNNTGVSTFLSTHLAKTNEKAPRIHSWLWNGKKNFLWLPYFSENIFLLLLFFFIKFPDKEWLRDKGESKLLGSFGGSIPHHPSELSFSSSIYKMNDVSLLAQSDDFQEWHAIKKLWDTDKDMAAWCTFFS